MAPRIDLPNALRIIAASVLTLLAPCIPDVAAATCLDTGIVGPLRVSAQNPRYFTNDCGRAVYLTGSHTWNNFPDMDDQYPAENQPFDFTHYLDFLQSYGHTFIRLWAWEGPHPDNANYYPRRIWAGPQPWLRTGPGTDILGLPRFDLTRWNQAYFDRLRSRVAAADSRGIYVSVMLFQGWEIQFAPGRLAHPFNQANNVNGVHFGTQLEDIHTLLRPQITAIQEEYVRRVIDAVNDFDNVLYEIANEAGGYSVDWQQHMIDFIRQYEATKPKQHPVGMTGLSIPSDDPLFASSAEWISPSVGPYLTDPPPGDGSKIILSDNDHLGGSAYGDPTWVWKSFTRGLNVVFMDRYDPPDSIAATPHPYAAEIRSAMGQTARLAARMDLLAAVPSTSVASTGYALAGPDELVIYAPSGGSFSVNLSARSGTFYVEWLDRAADATYDGGVVSGGATLTFQPPFGGDAVLYLNRDGSPPDPPDPPGPIGLVAAYGFEEGSGTHVADASGRGNSGTISGATWTTGRFGSALQFGGSGAVVTVPHSASLDLTAGVTLEAWVYPDASGGGWKDVIYKATDLYYLEGSSPVGGVPATGGSFGTGPLYGPAALPIRTWAHLAATYDGTTLRLYVNSVEVASRAQSGPIRTSTSSLSLGGDAVYGQYWTGRIDEVRIYDRALLPAEIEHDMGAPVASGGVAEATRIVVSKSGSGMDLSFRPACGASDHALFWGVSPIEPQIAWTGVRCGVGASGATTFDPGTPPPGQFIHWVVVGQSASREGSYGRDSRGVERPEAVGLGSCDMPLDVVDSCP